MRTRLAIASLCAVLILAALIPSANGAKIVQPGSSVNLAAPGPIGGTTPSTGNFTTLTATSAPALGPIGGTTSSTGQFTKICSGASPCTLPASTGGYRGLGVGLGMDWDGSNDHPLFISHGSGGGTDWHVDTSGFNNIQWRNGGNIQVFTLSGSGITIGGADNVYSTMARMPLTFPIAALSATTTTQWGEQKLVKAITIENVVFNVSEFACTVNPAISLFDCSNAAGTCTPVSTLATSGTLTGVGNTNAATTPTANVAAGEYIAVKFTAGTCTALNGSVEAMARPQ